MLQFKGHTYGVRSTHVPFRVATAAAAAAVWHKQEQARAARPALKRIQRQKVPFCRPGHSWALCPGPTKKGSIDAYVRLVRLPASAVESGDLGAGKKG